MSSVDAKEANFTNPVLDFTCLQLGTVTPVDQVRIDHTRPNRRPSQGTGYTAASLSSVWPISNNLDDDIFLETYP
ncbi:hypothetical protein [Rhizobium mongolense]|nr:hypothetical protein [Rhizobium mongolense]